MSQELVSQILLFAGPKRGQPTPGFSILIRSERATEQPSKRVSFVSRDQILVPIHSLRDKGTKGQHRNIGTKGQHRNKGTTQEQRNKGTKKQNKLRKKGTW